MNEAATTQEVAPTPRSRTFGTGRAGDGDEEQQNLLSVPSWEGATPLEPSSPPREAKRFVSLHVSSAVPYASKNEEAPSSRALRNQPGCWKRCFGRRHVDLRWIEKGVFLFHCLQLYALIWAYAQAWEWPIRWSDETKFILWLTLDLVNQEGFDKRTSPVVAGSGTRFIPPWGQTDNFWQIAAAWAAAPWVLLLLQYLLEWKTGRDIHVGVHVREGGRAVLRVLAVLLFVPGTLALGRLYVCEAHPEFDGELRLSVDPRWRCLSQEHLVTAGLCLPSALLFLVGIPLYFLRLAYRHSIYPGKHLHERYLRWKEAEFLHHVTDDWQTSGVWATSSFRRPFLHSYDLGLWLSTLGVAVLVYLFVRPFPVIQCLVLLSLLGLWLVRQVMCPGFRARMTNVLVSTTLALLLLVLLFGLLRAADAESSVTVDSRFSSVMTALHIISLVAVLLILFVAYMQPYQFCEDVWPRGTVLEPEDTQEAVLRARRRPDTDTHLWAMSPTGRSPTAGHRRFRFGASGRSLLRGVSWGDTANGASGMDGDVEDDVDDANLLVAEDDEMEKHAEAPYAHSLMFVPSGQPDAPWFHDPTTLDDARALQRAFFTTAQDEELIDEEAGETGGASGGQAANVSPAAHEDEGELDEEEEKDEGNDEQSAAEQERALDSLLGRRLRLVRRNLHRRVGRAGVQGQQGVAASHLAAAGGGGGGTSALGMVDGADDDEEGVGALRAGLSSDVASQMLPLRVQDVAILERRWIAMLRAARAHIAHARSGPVEMVHLPTLWKATHDLRREYRRAQRVRHVFAWSLQEAMEGMAAITADSLGRSLFPNTALERHLPDFVRELRFRDRTLLALADPRKRRVLLKLLALRLWVGSRPIARLPRSVWAGASRPERGLPAHGSRGRSLGHFRAGHPSEWMRMDPDHVWAMKPDDLLSVTKAVLRWFPARRPQSVSDSPLPEDDQAEAQASRLVPKLQARWQAILQQWEREFVRKNQREADVRDRRSIVAWHDAVRRLQNAVESAQAQENEERV